MDFELSDEQREFQQAARAFAEGELAPHAAHWDAESIFPVETIAKAGEMGFCGLYTPQRWGGLGLSPPGCGHRLRGAGRRLHLDHGLHHDPQHGHLDAVALGPEALCDEWVPALAAGQKLASYCLTEPQSGSDAASLRTKAVRDGDFYVLDGTKAFISGAGQTDMLIVMARTGGEGAAGHFRVCRAGELARHRVWQEGRKDGLEQPAHAHHQLRPGKSACR